jgi:hypothetical protein
MSRRMKLGTKSEIENMCVTFWCLTVEKKAGEFVVEPSVGFAVRFEPGGETDGGQVSFVCDYADYGLL